MELSVLDLIKFVQNVVEQDIHGQTVGNVKDAVD